MEYATAAGLREGDVLGITRTAEFAGGGGPEEVVELHAALLSRAQFCLPPTFAGARSHGAQVGRGLWRCVFAGFQACREPAITGLASAAGGSGPDTVVKLHAAPPLTSTHCLSHLCRALTSA